MPGARPHERLAAVKVDPELMLEAVATAADRRQSDILVICTEAYVEYIGLDARPGEDALTADDLLVIAALASRIVAFTDVLKHGRLAASPDDDGPLSRHAMIVAACTATLLESGGRPSFQLLDFLACAERAAKEPAPW